MHGRIALVVPAFPRVSETFIVSKFRGLRERGWDVHVVCESSDETEWKRFPELAADPGVRQFVHVAWPHRPQWRAALLWPVVLLRCLLGAPVRTFRYLHRGLRGFGLTATLRRLYLDAPLVLLGPDIVHFEFGALAPRRMYLKTLLGCRICVSFRGYDINFVGLDRPAHYRTVWARADGLHFLGEDLWRRAIRRGCPPEAFHTLIPPAIDPEFFRPDIESGVGSVDASRPLRILSVGRLEWKKGYEDALLVIRRLVDRGLAIEYRILGDGDYLGAVAFVRRRLELEGVVELLGALPKLEVQREMRRADAFLHSAVSEGFSNAVMEAQAMELPVVCTDADGLAENVEDGVTGFVVPRGDPGALADKVEILARDPALRRRMGAAGRKRVLEKFRLEDQIRRFEQFYGEVLARSSAAAAQEMPEEPERLTETRDLQPEIAASDGEP